MSRPIKIYAPGFKDLSLQSFREVILISIDDTKNMNKCEYIYIYIVGTLPCFTLTVISKGI